MSRSAASLSYASQRSAVNTAAFYGVRQRVLTARYHSARSPARQGSGMARGAAGTRDNSLGSPVPPRRSVGKVLHDTN